MRGVSENHNFHIHPYDKFLKAKEPTTQNNFSLLVPKPLAYLTFVIDLHYVK